ncbi:MAG: glycosyltransferase [Balneolaceae bacterium]
MKSPLHLFIIGTVWPEPESSAAGKRMMQILSLFQSQEWSITFASTAAKSEFSADLENQDITCRTIQLNNSSFDDFVEKIQPDVVLFDRFMTEEQFSWRVAEQCPGALRVLDTEDLHSLRSARQKALKENRPFKKTDMLSEDIAKREIASIFRCDLSLIISEAEMNILKQVFGIDDSLLHYLPFLLDPVDEHTTQQWPPFKERNHFISIGNFLHPPNWDAVLNLKKEIWPLIRKQLPDAELHVYGAYPSQKVSDLHHPETKFLIKGRAADAKEVVRQSKVLLAPLRFGAGLKGKLIEAMQCGTPSVTTDIGAEGIGEEQNRSGFIKNNPHEFADAAVKLYTDSSAWKNAQKKGVGIINRKFLRSDFESDFMKRIVNLKKNLDHHRSNNFTGAMLMHHTAASTKFMSKWIEEKNK